MVNPQSGDIGVSHPHRSLREFSWAELLPSSLVDDGLDWDGSQDDLERFHYVVGDDIAKEIFRRRPEFKTRLQKIGCNWNLIHSASECGEVELVKALVTKDASICSLSDRSNNGPLAYAAINGRTGVIHELLSPKVCIQLGVGEVKLMLETGLCIAIRENREAFRVLAMKYMEDWVHQDGKKAAKMDRRARLLMCAIQVGDFKGYKDLIDRCPFILGYVTAFPFGGTPLHIAIKAGKGIVTEFVKDIIRRRPYLARELDHKGHTPLDIASIHGYTEIVKELLGQVGPHLCSLHKDITFWSELNDDDDDDDEYHIEDILNTYINTKCMKDKDDDDDDGGGDDILNTCINKKCLADNDDDDDDDDDIQEYSGSHDYINDDNGYDFLEEAWSSDEIDEDGNIISMKQDNFYYGKTSIIYAIYHERISVISELLPIWWKSNGILVKARDVSLFWSIKTTKEGEYSEALKLLMAWYMRDELSNSGDWDTTNASQLASSYKEIVHHLLNPNILRHLSLFLFKETKKEGKSYKHFSAVIEVAGSTTNEEANLVYQMLLTTYYPEYFREVTAQGQSVLNLWVDKEKSVITFKLSMRNPVFQSNGSMHGNFLGTLSSRFTKKEIVRKYKVDNVVGTLLTIWKKNHDVDTLSSEDENPVPDGLEGGKDGANEGVAAQHPPNDECNENTTADNLIGNNSIMISQTYTSSLFGQKHSSAKECRDAILDASIRDKRYVKFEKSTRKLIIAKCSHESCKWRLDAKAVENGFLVRDRITEHTCSSSGNASNMTKEMKGKTTKMPSCDKEAVKLLDNVVKAGKRLLTKMMTKIRNGEPMSIQEQTSLYNQWNNVLAPNVLEPSQPKEVKRSRQPGEGSSRDDITTTERIGDETPSDKEIHKQAGQRRSKRVRRSDRCD